MRYVEHVSSLPLIREKLVEVLEFLFLVLLLRKYPYPIQLFEELIIYLDFFMNMI